MEDWWFGPGLCHIFVFRDSLSSPGWPCTEPAPHPHGSTSNISRRFYLFKSGYLHRTLESVDNTRKSGHFNKSWWKELFIVSGISFLSHCQLCSFFKLLLSFEQVNGWSEGMERLSGQDCGWNLFSLPCLCSTSNLRGGGMLFMVTRLTWLSASILSADFTAMCGPGHFKRGSFILILSKSQRDEGNSIIFRFLMIVYTSESICSVNSFHKQISRIIFVTIGEPWGTSHDTLLLPMRGESWYTIATHEGRITIHYYYPWGANHDTLLLPMRGESWYTITTHEGRIMIHYYYPRGAYHDTLSLPMRGESLLILSGKDVILS